MVWLVKGIERAPEGGFWREAVVVWFVEVKAGPTDLLNDNEARMQQKIDDAGAWYKIVRSVDDVERLLRRE